MINNKKNKDKMSATPRFTAKEIILKSMKDKSIEYYNIMDSNSNQKVATCYKKENADLVSEALNAFKK